MHDLIREVVYTELGEARRYVLHQRTLARLETEGAAAAELAYHALLAGEAEAAYRYSVQAGVEAVAVFAVDDAIRYYEQARALLQEQQRLQTGLEASEVEHLYAHLGRAYAFQNAWQQAQEALEELLAYAKQHQLPALVSMTLNRLAIQQLKDKPTVRALLDEAWRIAERSHDQKALAETAWNLAQITGIMWEDLTSSLLHGQQALSLARADYNSSIWRRHQLIDLACSCGKNFEQDSLLWKRATEIHSELVGWPPMAKKGSNLWWEPVVGRLMLGKH